MDTRDETVDLVPDATVENVARAALLAALTGAFAYVAFPNPVSPTDITLQVLGVFLAGILLGPVWGGISMTLYLVAGLLGAPVFLGGSSGLGAFVGPTGGYLLSYPIAAAAIGAIVHGGRAARDPSAVGLARLVGAMVVGTAIIYALGTIGFAVAANVGLYEAFLVSAVAFIPAEALKMAAAVGVVRSDAIAAS
ncbi:biotin transporter BioY [Halomarina pelagica]|uniref:biotin transporter BioY n=1 Tax=Halomarina pelagica TaxID=2961599 RepID=UPI0020C2DE87|nr:biotin transporter BioY [Halomarina sp. BND7]